MKSLFFSALLALLASCVTNESAYEEMEVADERRKTWVEKCWGKIGGIKEIDREALRAYNELLINTATKACDNHSEIIKKLERSRYGYSDNQIGVNLLRPWDCPVDIGIANKSLIVKGSKESKALEKITLDSINLINERCPKIEPYIAASKQRAEEIVEENRRERQKQDMEKRKQIEAERLASLERAERLIQMKKEIGRLKAIGATHNIFISVVKKPFCNEQLDGDWICQGAIACPISFEIYNFQELIDAYPKCETGASVQNFVFKPSQGKGLKLSFPNGDGRPWLAPGTLAGIPVRRGKNVTLENMFGRPSQAARWIEVSIRNMAH